MQYIEYLKKYLVFTGFFCFFLNSSAGSYEDFFKAVQFDDVKTVQALLQRGFDPNTVNPAGMAGLMIAVREPSLKVAQLLAAWPKVKAEVRNGRLYGRGAADMKAGLVALTLAFRALRRLGVEPAAPVYLQSVVEEECRRSYSPTELATLEADVRLPLSYLYALLMSSVRFGTVAVR